MDTKKYSTKTIAWVLLCAMFVYLLVVLFLSSGTFDYGDGAQHYLISRYSWAHKYLLLDSWGKPLFTFIASPFAQFGLKGISIFNIICGLSAAYFAYRIAEKLKTPYPFLTIIFTCSAPIYISVMNSGLTEPLFSLMLIVCIWLMMTENYYFGAIIFSFLPFVRAEYIFIFPLFVIYFFLRKKYFSIILMGFGTVFYSIVGYFHFKNLFWIITQNPYSATNAKAYGNVRGTFFSYIGNYHDVAGNALTVLIALGILWYVGGKLFFNNELKSEVSKNYFLEEYLLLFGSFIFILMGHTIIWEEGIFPTLGLLRYMSPIIPIASIIALRGFQLLTLPIKNTKVAKLNPLFALVFSGFVLYSPYQLWYKVPFQLGLEEKVITKATDWLKQSKYADNKIYYLAPYINIAMNIDPYNLNRRGELWSMNPTNPEKNMAKGNLLLWDAHFGPNEGRIKLETLLADTSLLFLQKFIPDKKFTVIGGHSYELDLFIRK